MAYRNQNRKETDRKVGGSDLMKFLTRIERNLPFKEKALEKNVSGEKGGGTSKDSCSPREKKV